MASITLTQTAVENARRIPAQTHAEAARLAAAELPRVIALIETLAGDDWAQPTDCTAWTVKDMVAHLAGSCAAYAGWSEFKRQLLANPYMRATPVKVDAINRVQVEDRADRTPEQLLAELRSAGPQAIRRRTNLPWLLRNLRVPFGAPLGFAPVHYLMETIYTRDEWMHRLDLCNATGKPMIVAPEHDGRITALALRDLAHRLDDAYTVDLALAGALTLRNRFGRKPTPDAVVTMDVFEFHRLASERLTPEAAWSQIAVEGDEAAARWFLAHAVVPY